LEQKCLKESFNLAKLEFLGWGQRFTPENLLWEGYGCFLIRTKQPRGNSHITKTGVLFGNFEKDP